MKPHLVTSSILILVLLILPTSPVVQAAAPVEIVDLGTLGGIWSSSFANAVNNRGQVTGWTETAYDLRAFIWENGVMTDLGTLGGYCCSQAFDINNRGQIVGGSVNPLNEYHAFLWENGVMTDLGTLGGAYSSAFAINDRGQVVGNSETPQGEYHAFLWEAGNMIDLGTLGGPSSLAFDINKHGQIVGHSESAPGVFNAFLWEKGQMQVLDDEPNSAARAINNRGQIVGEVQGQGAILWDHGVKYILPTLGGVTGTARAINDRGQIVGSSMLADGERFHAYLYDNGVMTDLDALSLTGGSIAVGISNKGLIVGQSDIDPYPSEVHHAALWRLTRSK